MAGLTSKEYTDGDKDSLDKEDHKENILCVERGAEIQDRFEHEGKVEDGDT